MGGLSGRADGGIGTSSHRHQQPSAPAAVGTGSRRHRHPRWPGDGGHARVGAVSLGRVQKRDRDGSVGWPGWKRGRSNGTLREQALLLTAKASEEIFHIMGTEGWYVHNGGGSRGQRVCATACEQTEDDTKLIRLESLIFNYL